MKKPVNFAANCSVKSHFGVKATEKKGFLLFGNVNGWLLSRYDVSGISLLEILERIIKSISPNNTGKSISQHEQQHDRLNKTQFFLSKALMCCLVGFR